MLAFFSPLSLGFLIRDMAAVSARWRKFAQLMADHFVRDEYWNMLATVMDRNGQPNHIWDDHRTTRPSLNWFFVVLFHCSLNLLQQV
jgi:hypothetical protein